MPRCVHLLQVFEVYTRTRNGVSGNTNRHSNRHECIRVGNYCYHRRGRKRKIEVRFRSSFFVCIIIYDIYIYISRYLSFPKRGEMSTRSQNSGLLRGANQIFKGRLLDFSQHVRPKDESSPDEFQFVGRERSISWAVRFFSWKNRRTRRVDGGLEG